MLPGQEGAIGLMQAAERFDPDGEYVRRYVPELGGLAAQLRDLLLGTGRPLLGVLELPAGGLVGGLLLLLVVLVQGLAGPLVSGQPVRDAGSGRGEDPDLAVEPGELGAQLVVMLAAGRGDGRGLRAAVGGGGGLDLALQVLALLLELGELLPVAGELLGGAALLAGGLAGGGLLLLLVTALQCLAGPLLSSETVGRPRGRAR